MNNQEFRKYAHQLVDWMADYLENIESYPVKSPLKPKEIIRQLPPAAPEDGEPFENIFHDFQDIIIPGITHWQHPSFHAYFPANSSPPSVLAEMLTAALAAQCMIWQTSPAAAELEERMMDWLVQMLGLPEDFCGVIQDTASTATLCSILTAREKFSNYRVNETGFDRSTRFTLYCSTETHSSIEKAIKIAGLGKAFLRKVAVDENFAMIPKALEKAIKEDLGNGSTPLCVVATLGTTGSTAIDPLKLLGEICKKFRIWLHVDAAFAGTALILPEKRWMMEGIEYADTFVFNPHKWMFTNFDCSAYFVKDKEALIRTFEILPEYLKTRETGRVNNYRDWGIPLGRRFRALKLWFVIRTYGVKGLQETIRYHLKLAENFVQKIQESEDFELLAPVPLNTICFRFNPRGKSSDPGALNRLNAQLLEKINSSAKAFLTHTKLNNNYTIRLVIGQTNVQQRHLDAVWKLIVDEAQKLIV
jgi:aromatic-L-amino-acid decarboxylase